MSASEVREIGSRLEPLLDDWLIDCMDGVALQLNHPTPREVAIRFDEPWEGSTCCYPIVFEDEGKFRMYYRGSNYDVETQQTTHPEYACYAESDDGLTWHKPDLGLFEHEGSKANNIIWSGVGTHNFTPFKDTNPDCAPEARYKALGGLREYGGGLTTFYSPDGLHWTQTSETPLITVGAFDSQNLAFWDPLKGCYVEYHRHFHDGVRDIMTCTSQDFVNWTDPVWLEWGDTPMEQLYTNAITPYFRAPHIYVGFPKRFMPDRQSAVHPVIGVSDAVFMSSRDGIHWSRWREAFVRPGLQPERWINRNNMTAWGILLLDSDKPGTPSELSIYSSESYYVQGNRLRRYALRQDGFVSVNAGFPGGEFRTKPLIFEGRELALNFSTSAAGSVRVAVCDQDGDELPGLGFGDCDVIFGDELDRVVTWAGATDVSAHAGGPVRLKFRLEDADIYALQFRP